MDQPLKYVMYFYSSSYKESLTSEANEVVFEVIVTIENFLLVLGMAEICMHHNLKERDFQILKSNK